MGSYHIPRNVKGEGRILFIFSAKALIYSGLGALVGGIFYIIFNLIGLKFIGIIIVALLGLIGFIVGTFKMPNLTRFEITKATGGENIDDVIKRIIKFKMKKNKIYTCTEIKEENTNE